MTTPQSGPPAQLPPIRVLPIPDHRPPALPSDLPWAMLTAPSEPYPPYIQHALAFELMPRRSDRERGVRPADLPDPTIWLASISQALIEIMAGLRSPAHVVRSCSPEVYLAVARRYASTSRRAALPGAQRVRRPSVARVHVSEPSEGIAEGVALLVTGPRVRAMAIRAEATRTGWRITALELG